MLAACKVNLCLAHSNKKLITLQQLQTTAALLKLCPRIIIQMHLYHTHTHTHTHTPTHTQMSTFAHF